MQNLDLSILEKIPKLDLKVILEIEPLAPLSMVSELPGSYYKTLKNPNKKMLCGLFENILGWHIDLADRKAIIKELTKLRKEQAKKDPRLKFRDRTKGSTYVPLLMEYFEIGLQLTPITNFYDDLWSKAYRRADEDVHAKGTFNLDYKIIPIKKEQMRNKDETQKIDSSALHNFFMKNIDSYPLYYSTPTTREYIYTIGKYQFKIAIDSVLYQMLYDKLSTDNVGFLGTSEGWVDLKFTEL